MKPWTLVRNVLSVSLFSEDADTRQARKHADYVLGFSSDDPQLDVHVKLVAKALRQNGLQVYQYTSPSKRTYLLVTAPFALLCLEAESMGMRKKLKIGGWMQFTIANRFAFEGVETESFFSGSEKQEIIRQLLLSVKTSMTDGSERSMVMAMLSQKTIVQFFPIHHDGERKELYNKWVKGLSLTQPIDAIASYFGLNIALYFQWLGFYTSWLVIPAIFGAILFYVQEWLGLDNIFTVIYSIGMALWGTLFLECWKRDNAVFAFNHGVINLEDEEWVRPEFTGHYRLSPITGEKELYYPSWLRKLKFGVGLIYISFMFCLVTGIMLGLSYMSDAMEDQGVVMSTLPTILYACLIPVLSSINRKIATHLTNWENHRTVTEHENSLVLKVFLFEVPNSFVACAYVAFIKQDMEQLRVTLGSILVTKQIIGNVLEVVVPNVLARFRLSQESTDANGGGEVEASGVDPSQPGVDASLVDRQTNLDAYELYDDYMEMVLQFGFVTLFASAFPLAALCCLANNVVEVRSDAFKLCCNCKRPKARHVKDIGIWYYTLETMSILAVISNSALIGITSQVFWDQFDGISFGMKVVAIVTVEHIIIAVKVAIAIAIPDVPGWIRYKMAREKWLAKQKLKSDTKAE